MLSAWKMKVVAMRFDLLRIKKSSNLLLIQAGYHFGDPGQG
jgi:hypothetical protein